MKQLRLLAAYWGLIGFTVLILFGVVRLSLTAAEALSEPLTILQWAVMLLMAVFMAYTEGYKGFQKSYSPRFADRALNVAENGTLTQSVLAPLYCMGFFSAPKRQLIVTYMLTIGIILLVILFHQISQPWRGILDSGVAIGLSWGLISAIIFTIQRLRNANA